MSAFFVNDTATPEIYTLSLHDALAICPSGRIHRQVRAPDRQRERAEDLVRRRPGGLQERSPGHDAAHQLDRKSTRLNSSHVKISYAVFCLKKKITNTPKPLQNIASTSP